jgi:hypothetical protein
MFSIYKEFIFSNILKFKVRLQNALPHTVQLIYSVRCRLEHYIKNKGKDVLTLIHHLMMRLLYSENEASGILILGNCLWWWSVQTTAPVPPRKNLSTFCIGGWVT